MDCFLLVCIQVCSILFTFKCLFQLQASGFPCVGVHDCNAYRLTLCHWHICFLCIFPVYLISSPTAISTEICICFCHCIFAKRQVLYLPAFIYKLVIGFAGLVAIRPIYGKCQGFFLFLCQGQATHCLCYFQCSGLPAVDIGHCHTGWSRGCHFCLSIRYTVSCAQLISLIQVFCTTLHYLVGSGRQVTQGVGSILTKLIVGYSPTVIVRAGHCEMDCFLLVCIQVCSILFTCKCLFQLQASKICLLFVRNYNHFFTLICF